MMQQQEKSSSACSVTPCTAADKILPFSESSLANLPFQLLPQRVHPPAAIDKLLTWQRKFAESIAAAPTFAIAVAGCASAEALSTELQQSLALQSAPAHSVAVTTDLLLPENLEGLLAADGQTPADFIVFVNSATILHPSALFVLMKEVLHLVSQTDEREHLADAFFANDVCLHPDQSVTYFRKESLSVTNPLEGSCYTALGVNYFQSFVVLSRRALAAILKNARHKLSELSGLSAAMQPFALAVLAMGERMHFRHLPLGLACVNIAAPEAEVIAEQGRVACVLAEQLEFFNHSPQTVCLSGNELHPQVWNDQAFLTFTPTPAANSGKVQVVIPFRDQIALTIQCVQSLWTQTIAADLEITLVNNGSSAESIAELETFLQSDSKLAGKPVAVKLLTDRGYFNFARLNNFGAATSNSPFLLFLNNDVQVQAPESLAILRAWCSLRDVGLVGGKLNYPSGAIQHAGINFSPFGPLNLSLPDHGTLFPREVNGVTFAMAMIKRCAFEEAGGLDELRCPNGFGDALLSFELRKLGWRTIYTPQATGVHYESASRGASPEEIERYEMVRAGLEIPCHYEDFQVYAQPMLIKPHALTASPVYSFAKRLAGNERVRRAILGAIRGVDRLLPKAK